MSAYEKASEEYATAQANLFLAREMGEFSLSLAARHQQEMAVAKARMDQLDPRGGRP